MYKNREMPTRRTIFVSIQHWVPQGGYILNLSTNGLTTGTYNLNFKTGSGAPTYSAGLCKHWPMA